MKQVQIFLFILFISITCKAQESKLNQFIPADYKVLESSKCDLNLDGITDYIVVLKHKNEENETERNRPLLIIEGRKNGLLKLVSSNNNVVLCKSCGGVFGDPYSGITVKKNYFSIEHYGGSNWRWTRIITFKYHLKLKKYLLHKDTGISYHMSDVDKNENLTYNKKYWGLMEFKNYKSEE